MYFESLMERNLAQVINLAGKWGNVAKHKRWAGGSIVHSGNTRSLGYGACFTYLAGGTGIDEFAAIKIEKSENTTTS